MMEEKSGGVGSEGAAAEGDIVCSSETIATKVSDVDEQLDKMFRRKLVVSQSTLCPPTD